MPNFKLGDHYKTIIRTGVSNVLTNHIKGFMNGFPLTHDEVQSCILSRNLLSQFEMLWASGARTIMRTKGVPTLLDHSAIEGLKRDCVLILETTRDGGEDAGFFTDKQTSCSMYGDMLGDTNRRNRLCLLDTQVLCADRVQALAEWAHLVVRAMRLRDMVVVTVDTTLKQCSSTAHLLASWPELATFAKEDPLLRKRLAAPPQKLEKYRVYEGFLSPKKQRDAANVVLTMGAMALAHDKNTDEAEVRAGLYQFEKLPTDPVF